MWRWTHTVFDMKSHQEMRVFPALPNMHPPSPSPLRTIATTSPQSIAVACLLHCTKVIRFSIVLFRGRDGSVGIATRYGLDGPGIESRWEAGFFAPVQTCPGAHLASYAMGTGTLPGVQRPGRGVGHPPPSNAEIEGRVEQYICFPSGPSWPVLGWPLPLTLQSCSTCAVGYFARSVHIRAT